MFPSVRLQSGADAYKFWNDVSVSKRIDAIASSFSLSIADLRAEDLADFSISSGDPIELSLENQAILSGYIDSFEASYTRKDHTITLTGRDNTCDLIDCSALVDMDEFLNQSIFQIAEALCNPLGVPVMPGGSQIFGSFKIDPGETVFEALDRMGKVAGVLFRPDGLGNLLIETIGSKMSPTSTALIEGQNITSASVKYDKSERFSKYIVLGQDMEPKEGEEGSEEAEGKALDKGIRYRPKLIIASTSIDSEDAEKLAKWESSVRAARSISVTITTQGWTKSDGSLWDVNELVKVISPKLGIDAYLLTTGVDFDFSLDGGTTTTIELSRIGAYQPKPVIEGDL